MPAAVGLGRQVRMCGGSGSGEAGRVRRRLAIAAANGGQDRSAAAKIGARDPQRLDDWVHRFNAKGLEGLIDRKPTGAAAEP
jgi:transposase